MPSNLRALLIDDDHRLAELLSEYLGQHGVEVVHALDGPRGLLRVEQEAFDVVLLDLTMPGMDGSRCVSASASSKPACRS